MNKKDIISLCIILICIGILLKYYYSHNINIYESFINRDVTDITKESEINNITANTDNRNNKKEIIKHVKPRKILITGSSNGIGLFLAIYLLKHDNEVAINGRNSDKLQKVLVMLQKQFPKKKVIGISADISTISGCTYLLNTAIHELGGLDILVNNASIVSNKNKKVLTNDLLGKDKMDWEYEYRTIINGNLYLTQNFIKYMKTNMVDIKNKKRIYTITSGAVEFDSNKILHYNNLKIPSSYILCKSTVEKMCKLMSNENTDSNVQIIILRIDSTFNTVSTKFIKDEYKNSMDDLIPYFNYFFNNEEIYSKNLNGKVISLHDVQRQKNVLEFDINRNVQIQLDNKDRGYYKLGNNPVELPYIKNDDVLDLNKYPNYNDKMIDFLVEYNNTYNKKFKKENINIFPGIMGCLEAVIDIFVPKRYQIMSIKPGWEIINMIAEKFDVDIMTIDINKENYTIDYVKILKGYNGLTRLIYLINPSYPFGISIDRKRFELFMKKIPSNIIVLVDLCYIEFDNNNNTITDISDLVNTYKNLICMKTTSKFYGLARLRVGYTISHPDISKVLKNYTINYFVDNYKYNIISKVLSDTEYKKRVIDYIHNEKMRIYSILDSKGMEYIKSVTNYFCVKVNKDLYTIDTLLEKNKIEPYMNELYFDTYFLFYIDKREINDIILSIIV